MKTTIFAIAVISLIAFLFACNNKKAQQTKDQNQEGSKDPITEVNKDNENPKPKPYQVVGYRKTACFGKCPVYEVKFFSDNTATWNGKMHVERMGGYQAKLDQNTLKSIKDKANEVGYLDFYNEYPVEHKVADLPSTITYLRIGDMEKIVKNTHEGPDKLAEYEAFLEGIISRLEWKAAAND